jgi:phenylacetic acid degradation operon negative regulatory protein
VATPPPPRALILGLYGAFARRLDADGWLAVAALVSLLAELGVDEPATRQAVSRMKRAGRLVASRRDGAVGYAPSAELASILAEGDRRIFDSRGPAALTDGWVLAVFSVPEADRHRRHVLRSQLVRLGFGNLTAGVWLAPARLRDDVERALTRLGLAGYVDLFDAAQHGLGDARDLVARAWDLDGLAAAYGAFVADCQPVLKRWTRARSADRDAYVDYVAALTAWRRLPYLDPGLPDDALPAGWEGRRAAEVFGALHERLAPAAARYVEAVVGG